MSRLFRNLAFASSVLAIAGCSSMGGMHGSNSAQNASDQQAKLGGDAQTVLQRQMSQPDTQRIPSQLIADARCIGVFPSVVEAGLIVGGQHGKGLVTCRQKSGGFKSANPAVFSLSGGSIGLQAGAQKSSVILLFETQQSVDALLQPKVKLGSQIAVTAGPSGYNHRVARTPAPVVAYVQSRKGLYAGIDLAGSKLSFDSSANTGLYGASATPQGVLMTSSQQSAAGLGPFKNTLQEFVPTASGQSGGQSQQQSGSNSSQNNGGNQQSGTNQSQMNGSQQQSGQQSGTNSSNSNRQSNSNQ